MHGMKSLCSRCSRNCGECLKSQLAMRGRLTYIYFKNGTKITNTCNIFSGSKGAEVPNVFRHSNSILSLR